MSALANSLRPLMSRAVLGCVFSLALSGAAFSQSVECPITSSTTVSEDTTLFLGGAPSCVVEGTGALTVAANGGALLNTTGRGAPVTMIIDSGGELQNNDYFQNFATTSSAYLGSTVVNFGTIYNNANGTLDTTDGTLTNASNLENFGTLDDETGGGGTLNNTSRIVNEASGPDLTGGVISVTNVTNFVGGSIDNLGTLRANNFTNNGTLTNDTGSIQLYVAGTLTNNGTLINAQGSGQFHAAGTYIAGQLQNNGTLTNNGAITVLSGGTLNLAAGSTYTQTGGGQLDSFEGTVSGPQLVVNGTLNSIPAVQLQGGSLFGVGTINGNVVNTGAAVEPEFCGVFTECDVYPFPGTSGTLTINGDYSQDIGGHLFIGLDGTGSGDFSVLDVSGTVSLDYAQLIFEVGQGFTLQVGDVFTFLNFGSLSGDFTGADVTGYSGCPTGDVCDLVYGANSVSLDVLAASSSGGGGGTGGTGNTPEPSSLLLLSAALLALIACSRAKRVCANA